MYIGVAASWRRDINVATFKGNGDGNKVSEEEEN